MRNITPTECAVLGLLSFGERSGYDLKKLADHSVGYFWTPAKSRIYATLPRLVEAGLVTRRDVAQAGKPDKQLYRLTSAGEEALRRWIAEAPPEPETSRNTLLVRVFFGGLVDPDAIVARVREHRAAAEKLKAELEAMEDGGAGDLFPRLTRLYGLEYAKAVIRWAQAAERDLTGVEAAR
ncbi:MAG TPA: PadR family transcriptional regulator [Gaiellaceae bacterium]|nr:PadR family transcriptional regulator [Gaiellaceae bacterium]